MAKKTDSIFDFDMTRFLSDLRIPGLTDAAPAMAMPTLPGAEALADAQKRNLETLAAANKLALDGMQAILRRQGEIVRGAIEDASAMAGRMTSTADLQQRLALQTEAMKDSFERTTANIRELAEMVSTSNTEVVDLLNRRVFEAFDELADVLRTAPSLSDAGLRASVADSAVAAAKPAAPEAKAPEAKAEAKPAAAPAPAASKPAAAKTNGATSKAATPAGAASK